jgi:hypothetical protein
VAEEKKDDRRIRDVINRKWTTVVKVIKPKKALGRWRS